MGAVCTFEAAPKFTKWLGGDRRRNTDRRSHRRSLCDGQFDPRRTGDRACAGYRAGARYCGRPFPGRGGGMRERAGMEQAGQNRPEKSSTYQKPCPINPSTPSTIR